jgi:small neutral amino acid transporter SnatA (MarC family)
VRRLIASLETTAAKPAPTASAPKPVPTASPLIAAPQTIATTAPPRHKPTYKKWWVWTVVSVVAAGAATGVALGVTQTRSGEQQLPVVHVP